jgi:nucleoside-triphosphatase THEP1
MNIVIFSRSIRSGKTTELQHWLIAQKKVAGILMPDINGSRKIWDIDTQNVFDIECINPQNNTESLINIGRFYFYTHAFEQANKILLLALLSKPCWLVIDEVGKLELADNGFYDALQQIIAVYQQPNVVGKLLLVVRDSLLEAVVQKFNLLQTSYIVVNTLDTLNEFNKLIIE